MTSDSERLCERARDGDSAAGSELILLHYERIFAYFRRLCANDEDAEDLTQKTFAKVWSSIGSFQRRSTFSTWIYGIAHHVYVDSRRRKTVMDFQTTDWWDACVADGPSPFEDTAERDLARQLYASVDQLDDDAKQAVHLHYYQGLSLKETADVLNVPTSTLKYRLREALNFLRSQTAEPKFRTGT